RPAFGLRARGRDAGTSSRLVPPRGPLHGSSRSLARVGCADQSRRHPPAAWRLPPDVPRRGPPARADRGAGSARVPVRPRPALAALMLHARYDEVAEWYDATLSGDSPLARMPRETALRLLGPANGRLLDIGCGGGSHTDAFGAAGWSAVGVDVSEAQLRLA